MLERLRKLLQPIPIAIVGAGAMGRGLAYQAQITPGIECVAVADVRLERAIAAVQLMGRPYIIVDSAAGVDAAVRRGRVAVCEDGAPLAQCESAQVLIESTSAIAAGGMVSALALQHGKHLVLMNAEVDLTFGPHLVALARAGNRVYASCDGDQHGVLKHLIDEIQLWGFELVLAGNIKGFLNRRADPTTIIPEADKRDLDYRMAAAYTDGTKLNIEMALLANALDLRTVVPGMLGPRAAHVREAFSLFDLASLKQQPHPVVDYILGAEPNGGVFAVGYCEHPYQQKMLKYYKMGDGPYYLFYRPYHLCHIEAMECVAVAALDGISLLEPRFGLRTNVFSYAKRALRAGEILDGVGGYTCYGLIENCPPGGSPDGLPICLAEGTRLKHEIPLDGPVSWADVEYDPHEPQFQMYSAAVRANMTSG